MITGEATDAATAAPLRVACLANNPSHEQLCAHLRERRFVWVDLEGPDDAELDEIEDSVVDCAGEDDLRRIFSLKRDLVDMRRVDGRQPAG